MIGRKGDYAFASNFLALMSDIRPRRSGQLSYMHSERRYAAISTAADGVFIDAAGRSERASLDITGSGIDGEDRKAREAQASLEGYGACVIWRQCQQSVDGIYLSHSPNGPDFYDGRRNWPQNRMAEDRLKFVSVFSAYGCQASRWKSKGQLSSGVALRHRNVDQSHTALLNDLSLSSLCNPGFHHRMSGSERWVTCKREFAARSEDTNAIVSFGICNWQDESGLRQVGPAGDGCHLLVGKAISLQHDRDRISHQRRGRKGVYHAVSPVHHSLLIQEIQLPGKGCLVDVRSG